MTDAVVRKLAAAELRYIRWKTRKGRQQWGGGAPDPKHPGSSWDVLEPMGYDCATEATLLAKAHELCEEVLRGRG